MAYKYPNVSLNYDNYDAPLEVDGVFPFLAPFVDALAVKYPNWTFEPNRIRSGHKDNGEYEVVGFLVYDDSNPRKILGIVGTDYVYKNGRNRTDIFTVQCDKLIKDRQRGTQLETTKLDVAIKTVRKYFRPPNLNELIDTVVEVAHTVAYNEARVAASFQHNYDNMLNVCRLQYIKDNWDDFYKSLDVTKQGVADLAATYNESAATLKKMEHDISNKEMLTVVLKDDKYVVQSKHNRTIYTVDDVPLYIRERIGMLKLVDKNTVLAGVGVVIETNDDVVGYSIIPE